MNFKKLMVSFVMLASVLFLLGAVNAVGVTGNLTNNVDVEVDGVVVTGLNDISLVAGEVVPVVVMFTAQENDTEVTVEVEFEHGSDDTRAVSEVFDVEDGNTYRKVLNLRVPFDLQDEKSDDLTLSVEIEGENHRADADKVDLRVQRPSFNVGVMSVSTVQDIEAGKTFPVDVVLKNTGYNRLNDLYVTVSIPELDIEKTAYFGDIVSIEDDDNDDTVRGRVFLKVPYDTAEGEYTLNVEVKNSDLNLNEVQKVFVQNEFTSNVVVSGNELVLLNPTNGLMALRLISEAPSGVSVALSEDVVVVPAGSSRTVEVSATGSEEYKINVFTMNGDLVESVAMPAGGESTGNNAVTVLTVIMLIVFLVLLAVLVVLVTKKPQKEEEFSESYY